MRKLNYQQRAEKWFIKQVKNDKLLAANYDSLSKRSAICYEPAQMISERMQKTPEELMQKIKLITEAFKTITI